jgi:hypothetical protein
VQKSAAGAAAFPRVGGTSGLALSPKPGTRPPETLSRRRGRARCDVFQILSPATPRTPDLSPVIGWREASGTGGLSWIILDLPKN